MVFSTVDSVAADPEMIKDNYIRRDITKNTAVARYTTEFLGQFLGIPHEILRVGYDDTRQIVSFYVYDPDLSEEDQNAEGQEPREKLYGHTTHIYAKKYKPFPTEEQAISIIANAIGYGVETNLFSAEGDTIEVAEERAQVYMDVAETVLKQIQEACRP